MDLLYLVDAIYLTRVQAISFVARGAVNTVLVGQRVESAWANLEMAKSQL